MEDGPNSSMVLVANTSMSMNALNEALRNLASVALKLMERRLPWTSIDLATLSGCSSASTERVTMTILASSSLGYSTCTLQVNSGSTFVLASSITVPRSRVDTTFSNSVRVAVAAMFPQNPQTLPPKDLFAGTTSSLSLLSASPSVPRLLLFWQLINQLHRPRSREF
ncbi:hypothetical protein Mapa_003684 [Marchantia paleacea]|nr:hypothetical protein Mapa_003684 [Marchantia paleacea]